MVIKNFVFYDGTSAGESAVFENENCQSDVITIQVSGTGSPDIEVLGSCDAVNFAPISVVSVGGFSVTDSITEAGIYQASLGGVLFVKLNNTGAAAPAVGILYDTDVTL